MTHSGAMIPAAGGPMLKSTLSLEYLHTGSKRSRPAKAILAGMNRRDFIQYLGAALAWPAATRADDSTRIYRIFWVSTDSQPDPFLEGFREGMRARGYVEG